MERRRRQVERHRHSSGGAAKRPRTGHLEAHANPKERRRSGEGTEERRRSSEGTEERRRGRGSATGTFCKTEFTRAEIKRHYLQKIAALRQIAASGFVYLHVVRFQRADLSGRRQGPPRRCTEHRAASHADHGADKKDPAEAEPFSGDFCVCFSVDSIR